MPDQPQFCADHCETHGSTLDRCAAHGCAAWAFEATIPATPRPTDHAVALVVALPLRTIRARVDATVAELVEILNRHIIASSEAFDAIGRAAQNLADTAAALAATIGDDT